MKYSIDLQSPFAFSNYWYVIAISLIAVSFVLRFLLNRIFAVQLSSPSGWTSSTTAARRISARSKKPITRMKCSPATFIRR